MTTPTKSTRPSLDLRFPSADGASLSSRCGTVKWVVQTAGLVWTATGPFSKSAGIGDSSLTCKAVCKSDGSGFKCTPTITDPLLIVGSGSDQGLKNMGEKCIAPDWNKKGDCQNAVIRKQNNGCTSSIIKNEWECGWER